MSVLPDELVTGSSDAEQPGWPARPVSVGTRRSALRLVTTRPGATEFPGAGRVPGGGGHPTVAGAGRQSSGQRPAARGPSGPGGRTSASFVGHEAPARMRLTRRGRIVVTMLMAGIATSLIAVIGLTAGGGAQAANHGRNGAGYQGMHQIVVQPGDTLWSIASRAEPSRDPRLVITEIENANSLTTGELRAGQVLWVPS
jgi:hypothetical protein